MSDIEEYKDIIGYEGLYQVSNLGNVKSLSRIVICKNGTIKIIKEKILKPYKSYSNGYLQVNLCNNKNKKTKEIHKLLAISFLNHKPCGYKEVVNHKDFDKLNNKLSNLELISQRENCNKKHLKSTSKYVGVSLNTKTNKWKSQIRINNKDIYLGLFINEKEASIAYNNKLKELNN